MARQRRKWNACDLYFVANCFLHLRSVWTVNDKLNEVCPLSFGAERIQ